MIGNSFEDFYPNTAFLITPLKRVTSLVVEKDATETVFLEILPHFLNYFKNVKRHRSIKDVEEVFKILEENQAFQILDELEEKEFEEENSKLNQELNALLKKHKEDIIEAMQDEQLEKILHYWIFAIEQVTELLKLSTKEFKRQIKFLSNRSKRNFKMIMRKFEDVLKGVFLVLFRITEQIYMITKDIPYELEKEVGYLMEDVVYLENLARITLVLH